MDGTSQYTGNSDMDGTYEVIDTLVNDHKCYKKGDNIIVHENDVFGNPAWVAYNANGEAVFYRAFSKI